MSERLIQEDFVDDPWKMLVCCILLNQTSNLQVRKILPALFKLIPTPEICSLTDPQKIVDIIRTTGFYNIKTKRIQDMSRAWIENNKIQNLPGIGKYGQDSWEIFINKNLEVKPTDKKLLAYLKGTL
jgi:endonuclease III